jgi:hypothetical protein
VQEAAIDARDHRVRGMEHELDHLERVANWLAERVVERDRELRRLRTEVASLRGEPLDRLALELAPPPEDTDTEPGRGGAPEPAVPGGAKARDGAGLFDGVVEVEIGPLDDFSQLVGFEDAAEAIGATAEISVKRFTRGRATVAMRLTEPVELLRELEERAPFEFRVRDQRPGRVVLDVRESAGEGA